MTASSAPQSVEALEELLSRPSPQAIEAMRRMQGDLLLLGVGGKMGPTLAKMAIRASQEAGVSRKVIGVSRFSDDAVRQQLESWGVETVRGDLLNEQDVASWPDAENVVWMSGMKFGASRDPALAWAMNCYAPSLVCRKFHHSRMVVFSSGNVYGQTDAEGAGSPVEEPPAPVGEYSMSALGRERIFQYFSQTRSLPMTLLRLNYATELRYGVLVDLAEQVWSEQTIPLAVSSVNVIWLGDACAMALTAFDHAAAPAKLLNLAGAEILRVRETAERLGELLGKPPRFSGEEGRQAYLNDARAAYPLLGEPQVPAATMLQWTADWTRRGGEKLGKPTHFQVVSGKF